MYVDNFPNLIIALPEIGEFIWVISSRILFTLWSQNCSIKSIYQLHDYCWQSCLSLLLHEDLLTGCIWVAVTSPWSIYSLSLVILLNLWIGFLFMPCNNQSRDFLRNFWDWFYFTFFIHVFFKHKVNRGY